MGTIWNFQSSWVFGNSKIAMPVAPEFWQDWQDKGEHGLYHGTSPARLESIMQNGLHPWDSPVAGGSNYEKPRKNTWITDPNQNSWMMPRPGHTYMAQYPMDARDRALEDVDRRAEPPEEPIVLKIDPSYLNPQHINPDEDYMIPNAANRPQKGYNSLGEMAEVMGYGVPSETESQISKGNHIAYRGVIPPEALQPGEIRNGAWQPIDWPRTASRFVVTASWELGQNGKGLYYPDTGVLQTWGDDRTHADVWYDDENASQGDAHHLILRPNGTVRDQGALNRRFEDVEGDTEGLQRALHELDPRLRLDAPSNWDFNVGPIEIMETEPSSIGRGEEGGKDSPTMQTSNDFAGSL